MNGNGFSACGYDIQFHYFNYASNPLPVGHDALAKAGVQCSITDKDGNSYYADSYCSVNDEFDQTTGEELALQRAMTSLALGKYTQDTIWGVYDKWVG